MNSSPRTITRLLIAWSGGDAEAGEELFRRIDKALRRLAGSFLGGRPPDPNLRSEDLRQETVLKLARQKVRWQNRTHFFKVAKRLMTRAFYDHGRGERGRRREGPLVKQPLDETGLEAPEPAVDILALREALGRLAQIYPRQGKVVELKYFEGRALEEIARELQLSLATVKRDWEMARTWLYRELTRKNE